MNCIYIVDHRKRTIYKVYEWVKPKSHVNTATKGVDRQQIISPEEAEKLHYAGYVFKNKK